MTYTRETILSMSAGRELDAIAAKLTGYTSLWTQMNPDGTLGSTPRYSSIMTAAMELEDKACTTHEHTMRYVLKLTETMNLGHYRNLSYLAKLIRATPEQRTKAAILAMMDQSGGQ